MEIWNELLRAALLGTGRQAAALPPQSGGLGEVFAGLNAADREGALLGSAAAVALYRRAGARPRKAGAIPEACGADTLPRCSPRAAQHLAAMLEGAHREVLEEWLTAAAASGKRAPEDKLPALLEAGANSAGLRDAILPAIGKRGAWLAAQRKEWSFASGGDVTASEDMKEIWETGSRDARVALLRRLRKEKPKQARELVHSTWKVDAPDDRVQFIATFDISLSMDDEPFLEQTLEDKRKEVRGAAAELLARLPESRLAKRMVERAKPLLKFTAGKKGILSRLTKSSGAALEVTLPKEFDKSMQRDTLTEKPPSSEKMGEKAWWLLQILAAIPPDVWTRTWKAEPGEIIAASNRTDYSSTLLNAWATATERHKSVEWAIALFSEAPALITFAPTLIQALPPMEREKQTLKALNDPKSEDSQRFLESCTHAWSIEFTRSVLKSLRKCIGASGLSNQRAWELRRVLPELAHYAPPAMHAEAAADWPQDVQEWEQWRGSVDEFVSLLQFRHDMLEALKE